jgi:glycosyltransferase involved in cell wall biosynthesis
MERKKLITILYFEPSTGYGGSSRCLVDWLRHLDKEVFKPVVLVYFDGPAIKQIRDLGVETITVPYFKFFKLLVLRLKGKRVFSYGVMFLDILFNSIPLSVYFTLFIISHKITLLHLNSGMTIGFPGIVASFVTRRPCVCHIHGKWSLQMIERFLGKMVSRFILLTGDVRDIYSAAFSGKKTVLIPNGIDADQWMPHQASVVLKEEFNLKGAKAIVGMAGRITRGKGHEDFISAAKIILSKHPDVLFIVAGSSVFFEQEYERTVRESVKNLCFEQQVIFTGWREDMKELMNLYDVFVFPTTTFPEGFPLTCIEAMALGKPMVSSAVPGPLDIIIDGQTGFLVPAFRPDMLAEKILTLIEAPATAHSMGEKARQRVVGIFWKRGAINVKDSFVFN